MNQLHTNLRNRSNAFVSVVQAHNSYKAAARAELYRESSAMKKTVGKLRKRRQGKLAQLSYLQDLHHPLAADDPW